MDSYLASGAASTFRGNWFPTASKATYAQVVRWMGLGAVMKITEERSVPECVREGVGWAATREALVGLKASTGRDVRG